MLVSKIYAIVDRQSEKEIKILRTNGRGEYTSREFKEF